MKVLARLRCFVRNQHVPVRHPLGGFKCAECGCAGADFGAMGFDSGYVPLMRTLYSRHHHGELTRTSSWETRVA
jgi:hypothetical protein